MFSIAYLWHIFKLGNGLWIGDECQAGAALHHAANIRNARLFGQIAQNAKGNAAGNYRGARVHCGDDNNVAVKWLQM